MFTLFKQWRIVSRTEQRNITREIEFIHAANQRLQRTIGALEARIQLLEVDRDKQHISKGDIPAFIAMGK